MLSRNAHPGCDSGEGYEKQFADEYLFCKEEGKVRKISQKILRGENSFAKM